MPSFMQSNINIFGIHTRPIECWYWFLGQHRWSSGYLHVVGQRASPISRNWMRRGKKIYGIKDFTSVEAITPQFPDLCAGSVSWSRDPCWATHLPSSSGWPRRGASSRTWRNQYQMTRALTIYWIQPSTTLKTFKKWVLCREYLASYRTVG